MVPWRDGGAHGASGATELVDPGCMRCSAWYLDGQGGAHGVSMDKVEHVAP